MEAAAWVCLLSPLAGALLITLAGTRISRRAAAYLSTLSVAVSFVASVVAFFALHGRDAEEREVVSEAWTWLAAGDFRVPLDILIDPLSVFMMLVVSGVGALIVAYSIGYMDGDDEERRYFAYMALFVFSMLLLVQSANFVLLLVGWGLVGLSSYLLIGFHHERPSAVAAAKKAFIMNAFGDATMALAIFLLFWNGAPLGALRLRVRRRHLADGHDAGGARDARRRGREVGADPAAHLAARRDGGPDAGQRADPRGHDGDGRRLPARAPAPGLRGRPGGAGPGGRDRRRDAARGRADRARPGRHQARDRLLDDVADRLHVPRRRARARTSAGCST